MNTIPVCNRCGCPVPEGSDHQADKGHPATISRRPHLRTWNGVTGVATGAR